MHYDFDPPALDSPHGTRQSCEPTDEYAWVYEQWLDAIADVTTREIGGETSQTVYVFSVESLLDLDVDLKEATAVPLAYPDRTPRNVGLFHSAAYNLADASVVPYGLALPVELPSSDTRCRRTQRSCWTR